jgi:hypothetical protein
VAASDWAFVTRSQAGTTYADLSPYLGNRGLYFPLNRPPVVMAAMPLSAPSARLDWLTSGVHELEVWRANEQVDALFRLVDVGVMLGPLTGAITLRWEGIETYLSEVNTPAATRNTGQAAHAWDVIDDIQGLTGGDYGFTQGLVPSTDPTKARTYAADEVDGLSSIQQLSERDDGFDFAFDKNRAFNCYYPYRGSDNGLVLEWQAQARAMSYSIFGGPGGIATDVKVKDSAGTTGTASDATARTTYGRREQVLTLADLAEASGVLDEYALSALAIAQNPIFAPDIELNTKHPDVEWGSFWLGDTTRVRARYDDGRFVNEDRAMRITGISVNLSQNNDERVGVDVDELLPMLIDRAGLQTLRRGGGNTKRGVGTRTLAERIAALERFVS